MNSFEKYFLSQVFSLFIALVLAHEINGMDNTDGAFDSPSDLEAAGSKFRFASSNGGSGSEIEGFRSDEAAGSKFRVARPNGGTGTETEGFRSVIGLGPHQASFYRKGHLPRPSSHLGYRRW